ncbi:MAG: hypothetical protein ACYC7F_01500 [Gemmatimonadaceae bacterium]
MTDEIVISGVCERDIDLFLVEEIVAEADFRAWLAMEAGIGAVDPAPPTQVRRSVMHSSGESDVEMTVRLADGRLARLLIENKVDAALQTKQAERSCSR